jgi:MurNAc alpha-1-phosphate uridylyltransferase
MPQQTHPVLIFAAGFGTRMGALTATRPKPLIEVAGKALLDHALALAEDAGAAPVVVNLHYLGGQIREHLKHRAGVRFSDEGDRILETGGGLRRALPLLGHGPVLTLNSDAVWRGLNPLAALAAAFDPGRMDALVSLVAQEGAIGHRGAGDFSLSPGGAITRGGPWVYTGAQIIRPEALEGIADEVFSMNLVWDRLIAKGRLSGLIHGGQWCDVGQPQSIALAEAVLAGPGHG